MSLQAIDYVNGISSLAYCVITIIIGSIIASKFFFFSLKNKNFLYTGVGIIGLSEPWLSSGVSFLWNLFTGAGLTLEVYAIIGMTFIPVSILLWITGITDLIEAKRKTMIRIIYIIIGIIFEIIFFSLLILNPSLIGAFSPESAIVHIDIEYRTFILGYLIFIIISSLSSMLILAKNSIEAENPEIRLKGYFLTAGVILWSAAAVLDGFIPLLIGLLPIIRIILATSAFLFYLGFIMPPKIRNFLLKGNSD
ncbi:MAG: conserved membrane protein of unknown function [Promethearchaeota archaeon]|nr:MAG: conserved membrane protein of unknown function [Candidatus Lokiarchaeota archaeon]